MTTAPVLLTAFLFTQAGSAPAPSKSATPKPVAQAESARPAPFNLTIKGGILGVVDVQVNQVKTKAIVDRLRSELKFPIDASQIVLQHKVDLLLKQSTTINLLLALAPVVLADLEVTPNEDPVWTAIHLLGLNEKEPARALKTSGFLLFAGVPPEDDSASPEELEAKAEAKVAKGLEEESKDGKPVLVVVVAPDGRVSLKSRQQPLIAILNEVASKAKVPLDLRGAVDLTPIDVDLRDTPLRDLGVALGRPGFRLVVRRNLATGEEVVHGILAGDAPKVVGAK